MSREWDLEQKLLEKANEETLREFAHYCLDTHMPVEMVLMLMDKVKAAQC